MSPIDLLVRSLAVPLLTAAVILIVARWAARRFGGEGLARAAGPLALGLGYLAGHLAVAPPAFPPVDVTDRVPWIVGAALLLELAEAFAPGPLWTRLENRVLLAALTVGAMLGPLIGSMTGTRAEVLWLVGLGLALAVSAWSLDAQGGGRTQAWATGLSRLAVLGGSGVALLASGTAVGGQLGLSLLAALAPVVFLGTGSGRVGGGPVLAAGLGALLVFGQVYASLPASTAVVLALSPLAAWLGAVGPLRRGAPWKAVGLVLAVTLAAVGSAVGLALASSPGYEG